MIRSSGMDGFSESGTPDDWDLGIGEVYGYRWWKMQLPAQLAGYTCNFSYETGLSPNPLQGANSQWWVSGRMEAVCTAGYTSSMRHEPPEYREACGCGFWAYFDKQISPTVIGGMRSGVPKRTGACVYVPVFGVIKGTGRIIIGEKGFRSQYAEIVGLCLSDWAIENLSHDVNDPVASGRQASTNNYGRLFAALKGNVWIDQYGRVVTSDDEYDVYQSAVAKGSVTEAVVMRRLSMAESILSFAYPRAKIMCDQKALTAYFPPDKNYA